MYNGNMGTKGKKTKRQKLIKQLDDVFSKYIRFENADMDGMCTCYTCGVVKHWKEMQNGHFWSRGKYSVRWDEDNCRIQCRGCNIMRQGNHPEYDMRMLREYGKAKMERLEQKKNQVFKVGIDWYEDMVGKYTKKVKKLQKIKNLD